APPVPCRKSRNAEGSATSNVDAPVLEGTLIHCVFTPTSRANNGKSRYTTLSVAMTFAVEPRFVDEFPLVAGACNEAASSDEGSRDMEKRGRPASTAPVAPKCVSTPFATVSTDVSTCPVFAAAVCVAALTSPVGVDTTATFCPPPPPPPPHAASTSASAAT